MRDSKPLVVSVGEILWDVLPTGRILGGSPVNVAWHAAQLGADSRVVSAVGDDESGREIMVGMRALDLDTDLVQSIPGKPTGSVGARIGEDGVAAYILPPDLAWDYLAPTDDALRAIAAARAILFGSLAQRCATGTATMKVFLQHAGTECLRIFDINLRPGTVRKEVLIFGLEHCEVVKLNFEELQLVAEMFNWPGQMERILDYFLAAYPGVRHLVVTRGADGVWWKTRESFLERRGRKAVVGDTIGASDALAAAVTMGLLSGMQPADIIGIAQDIAGHVCTVVGATPVLPDVLRDRFLRTASVAPRYSPP